MGIDNTEVFFFFFFFPFKVIYSRARTKPIGRYTEVDTEIDIDDNTEVDTEVNAEDEINNAVPAELLERLRFPAGCILRKSASVKEV